MLVKWNSNETNCKTYIKNVAESIKPADELYVSILFSFSNIICLTRKSLQIFSSTNFISRKIFFYGFDTYFSSNASFLYITVKILEIYISF